MRILPFSLLFSVIFFLPACKRMARVSTTGYIVGPENDMERYDDDNQSEVIKTVARSTVLIETRIGSERHKFCSGIIVADPKASGEGLEHLLVLTNFHCFAETDGEGKTSDQFIPEACDQTLGYVGFDYQDSGNAVSFKCKPNSLSGDFVGDLASFRLMDLGRDELPKPLDLWKEDEVPEGRKAFIIHHPDVKSNYQRPAGSTIRLPSSTITEEDCTTRGNFGVQEWPLDHALPFSFKHSCDLIHGSSGSSIADVETGLVLGINWGGIEISYKSLTSVDNAATKASYVNAFLNGSVASIQKEANFEVRDAGAQGQERKSGEAAIKSEDAGKSECGTVGTRAMPGVGLIWALPLLFVLVLRRRNEN